MRKRPFLLRIVLLAVRVIALKWLLNKLSAQSLGLITKSRVRERERRHPPSVAGELGHVEIAEIVAVQPKGLEAGDTERR